MSKIENKIKGRPTRKKQLEIYKILRPYYERGLTASFTAEKTGINIKTVCKYFNEWNCKLSELEANDFLETQKKDRERTILFFDQLIFEAYELLDYVNREIEKMEQEDKSVSRSLPSFKLEIIKSIADLNERKRSFTMQHIPDKTKEIEIENIDEEQMKDIVRHLALEKDDVTPSTVYSADEIMHEIIRLLKCDDKRARGILAKMKELGLSTCREDDHIIDNDATNEYNLLNFALMRDYVKEKEIKYMKSQNT